MTTEPRIAILPREMSSLVITAAVARGALAVAVTILVVSIPLLVNVLMERDLLAALPIPLAALVVQLTLLLTISWRRRVLVRVLYLAASTVCATAYMVALVVADPSLNGDATFLVNRIPVALALLSPLVLRPMSGLIWATIGLVIAAATFGVASLVSGVPIVLGWGIFTTWGIYGVAYVIVSIVRVGQAATVPDLVRLEEETRRMSLEDQFEQRAAAVIHDTVLGDLTAVMNTSGDLDQKARDRFRADVATLKNPSWLREEGSIDASDAALRNGSVALASEFQWRGLSVDLTGSNDDVVRLTDSALEAVHGALRACLDNVLEHSGVQSAQLVAGGDANEITYMVIDHGVGFVPADVPADRVGLREKVIAPIEAFGGSVRVWSQPGSGTSVLISLPTIPPAHDPRWAEGLG